MIITVEPYFFDVLILFKVSFKVLNTHYSKAFMIAK